MDNEGNVILTGGLVLQDATIWAEFIESLVIPHNNASELYFEENNIEEFAQKLDESPYDIEYVNRLMTHSWGQKSSDSMILTAILSRLERHNFPISIPSISCYN